MGLHKVLFIFLFILLVRIASGQVSMSFDQRLQEIRIELDSLEKKVSGLSEQAEFSVSRTNIQELLRGLAEIHSLNISVDHNLQHRVTNNFSNVKVTDLLFFLAEEYHLNIRIFGTIISVGAFQDPEPIKEPEIRKPLDINFNKKDSLLSVDFKQDSIQSVIRGLTKITGNNIILSPGLNDKFISAHIYNKPFGMALDMIAFTNGLEVENTEDGFYILKESKKDKEQNNVNSSKRDNGKNTKKSLRTESAGNIIVDVSDQKNDEEVFNIETNNAKISDILNEVSYQLDKNYVLIDEPTGNITCYIKNVSYNEFITYLFQATDFTYKFIDGVYLIGNRKKEGFRSSDLVKLQFRTIEEFDKYIPTEMKKGVDIKLFNDLNAIIMSGSSIQIDEIKSFIGHLDQPVPNIHIEVIVAEVNKGYSIQTGLNAFLSDSSSTQKSGVNQVFPGIDVSLSSNQVNKAVEAINGSGIVNIGKVNTNFYMTLKALEDNNDLDVQSTPQLSTLNGHEASLTIGQSRYYKIETQNVSGGISPIITTTPRFEQVEANLSIKILPFVSGNEHITMNIEAELSDFVEPTVSGAPPGNASRKFISNIRVRNEDMIILGGLERESSSKTRSGLPGIARIPIISWLFTSKSESKSKSQLIIFVRPTIVY